MLFDQASVYYHYCIYSQLIITCMLTDMHNGFRSRLDRSVELVYKYCNNIPVGWRNMTTIHLCWYLWHHPTRTRLQAVQHSYLIYSWRDMCSSFYSYLVYQEFCKNYYYMCICTFLNRRAEIFYSLATIRGLVMDGSERIPELLTKARRNLGLFQHHDGITGTAKELVVKDYAKR